MVSLVLQNGSLFPEEVFLDYPDVETKPAQPYQARSTGRLSDRA
jgi:hypothetical protein